MSNDSAPVDRVRLELAGISVMLELRGLDVEAMEHLVRKKFAPFVVAGESPGVDVPVGSADVPITLIAQCTPGSGPFAGHEPEADRDSSGEMTAFRHRTSDLRRVADSGLSVGPSEGSQRETWRLAFGFDDPRPVENALRVIVSERLRRTGGGVFHAAGIIHGGQGWLFPGISGAGKTTLSYRAGRELVLSDEMPAIRPVAANREASVSSVSVSSASVSSVSVSGFDIHATPFFGDMGHGVLGGRAPLAAIGLLLGKHASWCRFATAAEARQHVLSTYVLYAPDGISGGQAMVEVERLIDAVPVVALSTELEEPFESVMLRIRECLGRGS